MSISIHDYPGNIAYFEYDDTDSNVSKINTLSPNSHTYFNELPSITAIGKFFKATTNRGAMYGYTNQDDGKSLQVENILVPTKYKTLYIEFYFHHYYENHTMDPGVYYASKTSTKTTNYYGGSHIYIYRDHVLIAGIMSYISSKTVSVKHLYSKNRFYGEAINNLKNNINECFKYSCSIDGNHIEHNIDDQILSQDEGYKGNAIWDDSVVFNNFKFLVYSNKSVNQNRRNLFVEFPVTIKIYDGVKDIVLDKNITLDNEGKEYTTCIYDAELKVTNNTNLFKAFEFN